MNKNINYSIYKPKSKPTEIVIFVHGFAGDKNSSVIKATATSLTNHNIMSIAFDLPCHGEDSQSGVLNLDCCFSYLKEIIEYAKSYKLPLSIFATSFGGFLTLGYLKNNPSPFKIIILRAPAIFMDKILIENILPEHGFKDIEKMVDLGYKDHY